MRDPDGDAAETPGAKIGIQETRISLWRAPTPSSSATNSPPGPTGIALSRTARRFVIQNLIIATVFISGLVIWDLAGHLPLPLGVLGSTVVVGLNGLRLLHDAAWNRAARDTR